MSQVVQYGGTDSIIGYTGDWVRSTGMTAPSARAAANGVQAMRSTRVRARVAGRGGSRSGKYVLGAVDSAAFTVAADTIASFGPWANCFVDFIGGQNIATEIDMNGSFYFARGGAGTALDGEGTTFDGRIYFEIEYDEVPSQPTSIGATAAPGSTTVDWSAPLDDGGGAVNGYLVQRATNNTFTQNLAQAEIGTVTQYTNNNLAAGTTYYWRVAAKNRVTDAFDTTGPWSGTVSATTPTVPTAPTGLNVAGASSQASVSWVAPASNGGNAVTGYTLEWSTSSTFASGVSSAAVAGTSTTVGGLSNGSTYYFRVRANNAVGSSAWSATDSAFIATTPAAPTGLTAGAGVGSASLQWVAPSNDGGSPITGYTIEYALNSGMSGSSTASSTGTSATISGLTPGSTYYFRVRAANAIGAGAWSATVASFTASVPGAPTALAATVKPGLVGLTWAAPASDGGAAVSGYRVEWATDSGFTGASSADVTTREYTLTGLNAAVTYYFRVRALNVVGQSAASATVSPTTPARDTLDIVKGAAVVVGNKHVSIRSSATNDPNTNALTLSYLPFGSSAYTDIAVIPVASGHFGAPGGARNVALVADAAGNLYVIGEAWGQRGTVRVRRFKPSGASWVQEGDLTQSLGATAYAFIHFAAVAAPSGLFLLARHAGPVSGGGSLHYAIINTASVASSSGTLFASYGEAPSWLSTAPTGAADNSATVDVATLTPNGKRVALIGDGVAVVDVNSATSVVGVAKAAAGTATPAAFARVVGINGNVFAVAKPATNGDLAVDIYGTNATRLGGVTLPAASAYGGAFGTQWDATLDPVTGVVVVHYISAARSINRLEVSPTTYTATAAVVITTALGPVSSASSALRAGGPRVDERRVILEAANLSGTTKATVLHADTAGNRAPSAPVTSDVIGIDASQTLTLAWSFGDPNAADVQAGRRVQIQRVSDNVDVVDSNLPTAGTGATYTVAAGTLVNGNDYRWRVQTYDALGLAGAWSAYDTFTASALGTLTITSPATDNPAGLEVSDIGIAWSYAQGDGYTQTQRRVRVIRVSDSAVLSDTTMQASTATSHTVTAVPTDVPVRIEVSIITNAPGNPTVTANRLLTTSYGTPVAPIVTLSAGLACIEVAIINPPPTGSRPDVAYNIIERRPGNTAEPFVPVGLTPPSSVWRDHGVRSGAPYDYRARGVSA